MRRNRRVAVTALALLGVAAVVYALAAGTSRWNLTWAQEFNGPTGARPAARDWAYYTDRAENVSMDGHGHLAITAVREHLPGMVPCDWGPCDITSGRITTKGRFAQADGLFEARIRVPAGRGLWPAFWMLGNLPGQPPFPASGEIDAAEALGQFPNTVYGTVHGTGFVTPGIGGHAVLRTGALADAFHVYGVRWSPGVVTWLLDGHPYYTVHKSSLRAGQRWPFDHPFYLILNLAVGGTAVGPPTTATPFPARMLVDWVRVYEPS